MSYVMRKFAVAAVAGLLLSACVSSRTVPLAKSVASKGQEIATAALAVYDDVDAALDREKIQNDRSTFFGNPSRLPDTPRKDLSAQLQPRRKAFRAFKRAYAQLQALADLNAPADISGAATGLTDALNELSGAPDGELPISGRTKNLLAAAVSQITAAQQQRAIRRHNAALAGTAAALRELWNDDVATIKGLLTDITSDYTSTIRGLEIGVFDSEKLRAAVDEPYAASLAAGLYKFKIIADTVAQQRAVEANAAAVARSLDALVAAHTALDADQPSIQNVLTSITAITDALDEEER